MRDLSQRLSEICSENDANRKNLKVATLVSELFREVGCDPVVVGGSAVEFYSDGEYVSGDVDICQAGSRLPTPREREEIMSQIGIPLGVRKWNVCGVMVDLLGWVETTARTPYREMGALKLIQIEDLIAERILIATVPTRDEQRLGVARILLAMAVSGAVEVDFPELERVANSPDYRIGDSLRALFTEVQTQIQNLEP